LADLLAQCDPSAPYAGEVWSEFAPVGREFGAHTSDAPMPLERLHGTVRRYDHPTDPVWPLNDDDEAVSRAASDNPDLPRPFVADTLQGLVEVRNRHTKPLAQQSKIDDTEQPPPGASWNYRVMEFTEGQERWHAIHEVHYHRGVPTSYLTQPATLHWNPEDDSDAGDRTLDHMREALTKPVLRASDFA
jgi:hypothetical protein